MSGDNRRKYHATYRTGAARSIREWSDRPTPPCFLASWTQLIKDSCFNFAFTISSVE
ncbi:hypothetical protein N9L68_06510 [bacterium]|nr:hypothetical protein [bacterium]